MTYPALDYRFSSSSALRRAAAIVRDLALVDEENRSLRHCRVVLKNLKSDLLEKGVSDGR